MTSPVIFGTLDLGGNDRRPNHDACYYDDDADQP